MLACNDTLPRKGLSMRAIAAKVRIGKTTVIERLSGRCKGGRPHCQWTTTGTSFDLGYVKQVRSDPFLTITLTI